MKEGELKENFIEILKSEIILNVSKSIEEEFKRSPNPWMICFKGHIDPLQIYLLLAKKRGQISEDEYEKLDAKVENLKLKTEKLITEYPN